jgi:hypothetical protein
MVAATSSPLVEIWTVVTGMLGFYVFSMLSNSFIIEVRRLLSSNFCENRITDIVMHKIGTLDCYGVASDIDYCVSGLSK